MHIKIKYPLSKKGGKFMISEMQSPFFPRNNIEALAMLYVQNQNLSDKSPTEINTIYKNAYNEILGIDPIVSI